MKKLIIICALMMGVSFGATAENLSTNGLFKPKTGKQESVKTQKKTVKAGKRTMRKLRIASRNL